MPIIKIANKSGWDQDKPTIMIQQGDLGWEEAYQNWLNGKNPTDSPEWKKGVFATWGPHLTNES